MNRPSELDPLDALRAANPVRDDELPSASLARIRARVSEDVMTTKTMGRAKPARLAGLGIGVATAAALALVLFLGGRGAAPGVAPGSSDAEPGGVAGSPNGPISASCVEQYSPASLTNREFAFDGTVTGISGEKVTFAVNAAYRGASGESVMLDAPGMTGTAITSAGGPSLQVGERYLVAGDDTFVWSCGFTQPYDEAVAGDWAEALGG